jgi:hypothetical protein
VCPSVHSRNREFKSPRTRTGLRLRGPLPALAPEPLIPAQVILAGGGRVLFVPDVEAMFRATGPGCSGGRGSGDSPENDRSVRRTRPANHRENPGGGVSREAEPVSCVRTLEKALLLPEEHPFARE